MEVVQARNTHALKINWIKDMEREQHELSSNSVHYHLVNTNIYVEECTGLAEKE